MTSVQEWKKEKYANTSDIDHRQAIDALASLLENKTSPAETAKAITAAYEPRSKLNEKIENFWVLYMCEAIRHFGDAAARERLVDLLGEMSRLPDVKDADGSVQSDPGDAVFWRDMPRWAYDFKEYGLHYGVSADFADYEIDDYYAQALPLLNATRFGAAVLSRGEVACRLPAAADLFLEEGIEEPYDETRRASREWQVLLPPAATWLLVTGSTFYRLCHGGEGQGALEGETRPERKKWDGRVWSPERWALWKERLQTLADRDDISDECRGFAAQARKKMEESEAQH